MSDNGGRWATRILILILVIATGCGCSGEPDEPKREHYGAPTWHTYTLTAHGAPGAKITWNCRKAGTVVDCGPVTLDDRQRKWSEQVTLRSGDYASVWITQPGSAVPSTCAIGLRNGGAALSADTTSSKSKARKKGALCTYAVYGGLGW